MPFDAPFFQRQSPGGTVEILNHEGRPRTYTFPTFFTGSVATFVVVTARIDAARALLGDVPLHPVAVWPGRCLATIALFRYGELSDGMKGYHEAAVGFGVAPSAVPLLPAALRASWPSFGVWVTHLPVDSAENERRGVAIWNLPKVVRGFDDRVEGGARTVEIAGAAGLGLRVRVPIAGGRRAIEEENRVYSRKDGTVLRTRTRVSGAFSVWSAVNAPAGFAIEVGTDPWFAPLRDLDLGQRPLLVRHCDAMDSALYLGEPVADLSRPAAPAAAASSA